MSSAPIFTQMLGSNAFAASAVPLSRNPGTYPPIRKAPPAAVTVKKVRLVRVFVMLLPLHACRAMNCATNTLICSTAADIAGHGGINVRVRRFRLLCEQRRSRHQLSGLTVTTLRDLFGDPCRLQRVARRRGK